MYKISAVTVRDFKRIYEIQIEPDADANLILIDGLNRQGKSSLLDALSFLIEGPRAMPPEPIRRGADEAFVEGELQHPKLGVLRIVRKIKIAEDGSTKTTIKLSGPDGEIKSPQKILDGIIGSRLIDPIAFLHMKATDQRAMLFKVIDKNNQLATLDAKRESHYTKRTELGRSHKHAVGEFERLPPETAAPELVDVADVAKEIAAFEEQRRELERLGNEELKRLHEMETEQRKVKAKLETIETIKKTIADLQAKIVEETKRLTSLGADIEADADAIEVLSKRYADAGAVRDEAKTKWEEARPRFEAAKAAIEGADANNKRATEIEFANRRRKEAEDSIARMKAAYDEETSWIEKIDRRKSQILAEAKLPLETLSYDANGITLNGLPFEQASGAEQFRVALGIAAAAAPNLADVWIRDGAILDDEQLAMLATYAKERGACAWIERVGKRDDGAIVIEDGRVIE